MEPGQQGLREQQACGGANPLLPSPPPAYAWYEGLDWLSKGSSQYAYWSRRGSKGVTVGGHGAPPNPSDTQSELSKSTHLITSVTYHWSSLAKLSEGDVDRSVCLRLLVVCKWVLHHYPPETMAKITAVPLGRWCRWAWSSDRPHLHESHVISKTECGKHSLSNYISRNIR